MRVHELAKILALSSIDLIKEIKKLRVPVVNHMSSLEDKHVRKIMKRFEEIREEEEEKRKIEQQRRAEEQRLAEIKRKEEEAKKEEERRLAEIKRKEEEAKKRQEEELRRKEEEKKRKLEEEKKKELRDKEPKKEEIDKSKPRIAPTKLIKKDSYEEAPHKKDAPFHKEPFNKDRVSTAAAPIKPRLKPRNVVMSTLEKVDTKEGKKTFTLEKTFKQKAGDKPAKGSIKEKTKHERRFKPTKLFTKDSFEDPDDKLKLGSKKFPRVKAPLPAYNPAQRPVRIERPPEPIRVKLYGEVTVSEFADKIRVSAVDIIKKALMIGTPITINQTMDLDLAEIIASEYNVDIEIIPEGDKYDVEEYTQDDKPDTLESRPPVVTIMGHVDHGKTSLLDKIRESDVVGGESGGITQHIGAYYVHTKKGDIVFLDTPGHEAFTAMRSRGAKVTDIVVIVIAANESVKPQTIEAINHSKEAKVPIIIAINKMDLPSADPEKVKQDLLQHGIVSEELGGDVLFVETSAKKSLGVDKLLDLILLQAEVLELKANPNRASVGAVVESKIDNLRGVVATVLIQKGTLRVGDCFVAGTQYGKVRAMINDREEMVEEAKPAHPVEIIGLSGAPEAGDSFIVVPNEKVAHQIATTRSERRRKTGIAKATHISLENLHNHIEEGKIKELKMILKGDVQGSIEAILQSLAKLSTDKVKVRIIHSAVGGINESDINLADTADALIIGFHVRTETNAKDIADEKGVQIKIYHVIYDLINDIEKSMIGMLDAVFKEIFVGRATVRQAFKVSKVGTIAGCYVEEGSITKEANVRLYRDNIEIKDGKISSLKRLKDDASRVQFGLECGIGIENYNDIREGDIIEAYKLEELPREL